MAEFAEEMFEGFSSPVGRVFSLMSMGVDGYQDDDDLSSSISSNSEGSDASAGSSSLDFAEAGTSSTSSSSLSSQVASDGPLYELSSLMAHLPIKRGLSKYFQGKSQSFTSLSNVRSIEDLAKREVPYGKKMKSCKSFAGGLDCHRSYALGTCTRRIAKKGSKGSCSSLMPKRNNNFIGGGRPPSHAQRNY